jgi:hypothetical protein
MPVLHLMRDGYGSREERVKTKTKARAHKFVDIDLGIMMRVFCSKAGVGSARPPCPLRADNGS